MKSYLDDLPRPFLVLAPLYDVTDTVFRRVVAGLSPPDLMFTEFVNADGLQSAGRDKLVHRLKFTEAEQPLIAQIWGRQPENFYKTTLDIIDMGYSGVDLNMGCPDKAVLKNTCGGAMIQHPEIAAEIIKAVQKAAKDKIPVSVKTRIGFREYNREWIEALLETKLSMLSIHLRTVREMSKVPAHWEYMSEIRELRDRISPDTLIVGNGDVMSRVEAEKLAKKHGVDGVMIGRGVFHDPFIFAKKSPWQDMNPSQKIELYKKHVDLFASEWENNERPIATLNKFCKIYVSGFDGAREIRDQLMSCKTIDELKENLRDLKL